jgi:hypothetical protein
VQAGLRRRADVRAKELLSWVVLGVVAAFAVALLLPRAFPLLPRGWEVDAAAAETIALERLAELGELPDGAMVVVAWEGRGAVERRLLELGPRARDRASGSHLERSLFGWVVTVYAPDSLAGRWAYRAQISPHGEVTELRRQLPDDQVAPPLDPAAARGRADELLAAAGIDLRSLGEPELRQEQRGQRPDLVLRYPAAEQLLGDGYRHGVAVRFLGDRDGGFEPWLDEPPGEAYQRLVSSYVLVSLASSGAMFLLLIVLAVLFARKYHAGEVGVRRAGQVFLLVFAAGVGYLLIYPLALSEGLFDGAVSRRLGVLVGILMRVVFSFLPIAAMAALAWSVGESWARERWGGKLAAFDALFKGDWRNATVARAGLRGAAIGVTLAAALLGAAWLLQPTGAWPLATLLLELQLGAAGWLGVGHVLRLLCYELAILLVACLFFNTAAAQRLPAPLAALLASLAAMVVTLPPFVPLPVLSGLPVWVLWAAVPVLVFRLLDLLTALLSGLTAAAILFSVPLLVAADSGMQLQGTLPLLLVSLPLLVSVRQLHRGREFVYRWEDVPPHVRRIAERERQRVELETAREIQSSILPILPPQLAGVAIAHAYLPASEVGGDFYDVLALDDGRLAVAVGDVAGHGVSSGLVMSMVRSALAVQVTFDPGVEAVFATLNRMVYQSARRRLLTTLTYALVDPRGGELVYASAGHIFPYRVTARGRAFELEAGSYPLGVRSDLRPVVRRERLEPGDYVVLLSDGVVEARGPGDEPFGFARLASSLERGAGGSPDAMVRGVLDDLAGFTGGAAREDDVTLVALRLP